MRKSVRIIESKEAFRIESSASRKTEKYGERQNTHTVPIMYDIPTYKDI